jgi:hypothetical protein
MSARGGPVYRGVVARDDLPERRRLALARATASRIRDDPALLQVGRENLPAIRAHSGGLALNLCDEWEHLIAAGPEAVADALVDPTEHGHDLRQQSPFAGVLTNEERWAAIGSVYPHAVV